MTGHSLRERYCKTFNCSAEEFRERVFWQCLPKRSVAPARLIRQVNGSFFEPDLELIEQVADSTSVRDIAVEIEVFRYHHPPAGLLRGALKIRVSGKRLLKLSASVLHRNEQRAVPERTSPTELQPGGNCQDYLSTVGAW